MIKIAAIALLFGSPSFDAAIQNVFHGPGPKVDLSAFQGGHHWRRDHDGWSIAYPLGDGVCTETHHRNGVITIVCVG